MTYDPRASGALDYAPCRYGKSKLTFRGPFRQPDGGHVTVLGGTETYGRFIETPYPEMLQNLLGRQVLNLGTVNAGVDVFLGDPTVLDLCRTGALTVIEITGAHNMSNRFYAVHPRRNDRFLRASTTLKAIYRDVDFTDFHFTRHLLASLAEQSPEKFDLIGGELKEAWVGRMSQLIDRIEGKVVLLWLADHRPDRGAPDPLGRGGPLFVDSAMIDSLRQKVVAVVEVVADAEELADGYRMMRFTDLDTAAAREMLGPVVHKRTAHRLAEVIGQVLSVEGAGPGQSGPGFLRASRSAPGQR
jgi:hypothetical protein